MFVSALSMFRHMGRATRYAVREEGFLPVAAAALILVALGTAVYTLGEGWGIVDAFYFAVATSSIADPKLVLSDPWLKVFTAFYILIGIGILVEVVRRLGFGFVAVLREDRVKAHTVREKVQEKVHETHEKVHDGPEDSEPRSLE